MSRSLESTWKLTDTSLSREDFIRAFQDFDYFTSHCQQIVDKRRRLVYMRLNAFQRYMFGTLYKLLDPNNRLDERHDIVICKPRQCGMSTGMISFISWFLSCAEGIDNFVFIHILPATDTITKLYSQKVEPIITGVVPDIMATIEKAPVMSSSIRLHYKNILGVERNNYYDLVSANASSLRSGTANAVLFDEVAFYRHPEELENAVSPMIPPYGFSLVIYASTFDDKQSEYFKNKIITAQQNPENWTLLFAPWFMIYPEEPMGKDLNSLELTEYDEQVILPAFREKGLPMENWADAIAWYHNTALHTPDMKKEFPTTIEEVLAIGEDKSCFVQESLEKQEKNLFADNPYQLVTDTLTNRPELKKADESPIQIYKAPVQGERYILTCDPISSNSDESDFFAASIWNARNNEQVATLCVRGIMVEDMADMVVGLAIIYNRALICPESNMAEALLACLRAKGYYHLYYADKQRKARKEAGIRTTVASKPNMIDKLQVLLDGERIIIHSQETLRQLKKYKKVQKRSGAVAFSAPKGDHDDMVTTVFLYAGMLDSRQLAGKSRVGFTIL